MIERVYQLDPTAKRPGELTRRVLIALGATVLGAVVLVSVILASVSDRQRTRALAETYALCQTARVGTGRTCQEQVSSLAETTVRVRALGTTALAGWRPYEAPAAPTPSITSEPARDPRDPCPLGDPADLCRCRHELRDAQSGLRQAVSGRCIAVFRRRATSGG